jgi:spore germination cell wall hydrolase CwlJ-like protein|tara:strand:- start:150 stop:563 length:414 start_codon:yes stop_codon:yes gene_type:complete
MISAVMCLALNLYFEARGEPLAGQLAVGFSTMNRVADERYPDTVCEVVKQAKYNAWDMENPIRHRCQYSWFCDGMSDEPKNGKAMLEASILAQHIYYGHATDISQGATHYHATWIDTPYWADEMDVVLTIDQHIFYR